MKEAQSLQALSPGIDLSVVAPDAGCPPTTGASRVDASGWILVRQVVMARTASAFSSRSVLGYL
jgi:hypothetical protein